MVEALEKQFYLFGFSTILHSDNGREFNSKKMAEFCKTHKIKQVHGAPRTPTTQGLVERNNRTVKENMKNIITKKNDEEVKWCKTLSEAAYKKNIFVHSATGKSPYETVFGILPRKEVHVSADVKKPGNESTPVTDFPNLNKRKHDDNNTQRKKLKTDINERQLNYNSKMKKTRKRGPKFHVDEYVSIKIDPVDKISPLHPNVLIGKITEVENDYAKIVTKFGRLKTYISTNRLN